MAVFSYKAKTKEGEIKEGTLVAGSKKEAGEQLRGQQLSPLAVKKADTKEKGRFSFLFGQKVSLIEKANLCRYLATMIGSGLPLSEAVEVLAEETAQPMMQRILADIQASLQSGQSLSIAFAKYPDCF